MILVTGGGGFIGSNLVRRLVRAGERVRVFGRFDAGLPDELLEFAGHFEVFKGDIRDEDLVHRATESVEVVFHLSGIGSPSSLPGQFRSIVETNILGTQNALSAATDAGVRRFVLSSSASVYGDLPYPLKSEGQPMSPQSAYAASKIAAENWCRVFHVRYGLETVPLRFFNVYGPGQDRYGTSAMVVPSFVRALRSGNQVILYGDGEQTRDFVFIDDVLEGALSAIHAPRLDGEPINIGSGQPTSILEMIQTLSEALNVDPIFSKREERLGEVRTSVADIERARSMLGFEPKVSVKEGATRLARTIRDAQESTS